MYPPRQVYRPLTQDAIADREARSLARSNIVNLYFHFPFCRQICAFCNLYAIHTGGSDLFEGYLQHLEREVQQYEPLLRGKQVDTLYLGGGTPSLLGPERFARFFAFLRSTIGLQIRDVPEVALEVSPETVTYETLRDYRAIGINRINLGFQSTSDAELHVIGRSYDHRQALNTLAAAQKVAFPNICVDLIYGLRGQDLASWKGSLSTVLGMRPETICAYPLTLRPFTGFSRRGYVGIDAADQLAKYDYAALTLQDAGYLQETHIRYILSARGGYRQKANHWAMQNVLGFGAGARSYLWECDFRNGYSVRDRQRAYREYLQRVQDTGYGRAEGFLMEDEERRRKAVILGLISLDRTWYRNLFESDVLADFRAEFGILEDLGLIRVSADLVELTELGLRHRDVVVQAFFGDRVRDLLVAFDYAE